METLDSAFGALSDPVRRAILARLALGEATVMELAAPFAISQPAVSRHVKVLVQAGLIVQRVDGTRRPCRLSAEGLRGIEEWMAMLRKGLEKSYERLDVLLEEQKLNEGGEKR